MTRRGHTGAEAFSEVLPFRLNRHRMFARMADRTMPTRIALFGFVLAAMPIASAQAEDRDYPRQIGPADGIFCQYEYSLSKLPSSATDPDKWWKTPHTVRVQKIECNGIDLGAKDEDVEVKYRRATVKTDLIGELTVIISGGENKNKLETELRPSQIRKIKRLSWLKVLVAQAR
jgi:hypothetical protein